MDSPYSVGTRFLSAMSFPELLLSSLRCGRQRVLPILFGIALLPSFTLANPSDGVVSFGDIQFEGGAGNLTIRQGSDAAIINWGSFSIQRGEVTRFVQPGSNSAVLNRVTGSDASALDGALEANGKVFLINPNGIIVGPSGTIDVGGLVLSTLDISDEDFLGGDDLLFAGDSSAGVVNFGRISAIEGDVFLIGNSVTNAGTIEAANGTVGLAAGSEVLITADPDRNGERVFVRATAGPGGNTGIENSGSIQAAAVELKATGNLYALAINNSGSIRATGARRNGGRVYLRAPGGRISNTGSIEATIPGSAGGQIFIDADELDLGGSLSTDPEGNIDLRARINLLPGASIAGQDLSQLLAEVNDPDAYVNTDRMLQEGAGHPNKLDDPTRAPGGQIIRAGRYGTGPIPIAASTLDNGRVVIGMPGISREPVVSPPVVTTTVPTEVPAPGGGTAPTRISPMTDPDDRGTASPTGTATKPPVPTDSPDQPRGDQPRP